MSEIDVKLAAGVRNGRRSTLMNEIYKHKMIYLFISPFFILFAIFGLFPILFSFYLSFHKWDGIGEMTFAGLDEYVYLLHDADFWKSIANTLEIWIMSTIPMLFIAMLIAFLLNSPFVRFRTFYRVIYFLPNVTSIVAVAIVFGTIFGDNYGFLNFVLKSMGADPVHWLSSPFTLKVAIAVMVIWRWTGYNAIIFLAGLQGISQELYEAARIDGATMMQTFARITVPLLRPIMLFTLITSTIGGMQIFTEPQILTNNTGGPGHGGMTIVLYLYQQSFLNHMFGYGSAVAWGMFVIIALFSLINWKVLQMTESK
jgi:cellobiose transport system permease protein